MLSPFSSHPREQLHSWPRGYLLRLWERSSRVDIFNTARDIFINKLKECGHDREYIEYITSHAQFLRPHWSSSIVPFVRFRADILWFVLPYHPLWVHAGLKQRLTQIIESTYLHELLCEAFETVTPPQIRISWSIKNMPFGSSLLEW
jgi:hypothetical protein